MDKLLEVFAEIARFLLPALGAIVLVYCAVTLFRHKFPSPEYAALVDEKTGSADGTLRFEALTAAENCGYLLEEYREDDFAAIRAEEKNIDMLADRASSYMVQLSPHLSDKDHVAILDQYYKLVTEFERLGDHAVNIAETAEDLHSRGARLSREALGEIRVVRGLTRQVLNAAIHAFEKRDLDAAVSIEPMEEVIDDLVNELRENHLDRLRAGKCTVEVGSDYLDLLSDLERISDICSNVGIATVLRILPERGDAHAYISSLHAGRDEDFNRRYNEIHREYFGLLEAITTK